MIDTHCHVDLYPHPTEVAETAERAGVLTLMVTNLPSAFDRARPHVRQFANMRLALGLHPLVADRHAEERERFKQLSGETSYIGEVGLDFSRDGYATKDTQIESFRFVLDVLRGSAKFITVHSRRAEPAVLDLLEEAARTPVVFHWYSGPVNVLDRALELGHYFSVNPAMTVSPNGRKIIGRLPPERVLTESDGPFVQMKGRSVQPSDVEVVEDYLAAAWKMGRPEAATRIRANFMELVRPLRVGSPVARE